MLAAILAGWLPVPEPDIFDPYASVVRGLRIGVAREMMAEAFGEYRERPFTPVGRMRPEYEGLEVVMLMTVAQDVENMAMLVFCDGRLVAASVPVSVEQARAALAPTGDPAAAMPEGFAEPVQIEVPEGGVLAAVGDRGSADLGTLVYPWDAFLRLNFFEQCLRWQ